MVSARSGPRYVSRFACIGPACESTCCSSWSISVDEEHYRQIHDALGKTREDRQLFAASLQKLEGDASTRRKNHALIVLQPKTQSCSFLGEDRLCVLHRRFGEGILPDTCATYPRRQSVVEGRIEIAAALSCPEAARLALLAPDAMEIVDLGSADDRRDVVQVARTGSLYEQALDLVRLTMRDILVRNRFVAYGVGTLTAMADLMGDNFSAKGELDERSIVETLDYFRSPGASVQIATALTTIEVPLDIPMQPLLEVLRLRVEYPTGEVEHILDHAVKAFAIGRTALIADVAARFGARRDQVGHLVEDRLNAIMKNYALNHLYTNWFTHSRTLGIWVRGLILRIALVRFLVYAHPMVGALETAATEGDAERTVERVAVEVVHKLSRSIEHHQPFLSLLEEALPEMLPQLEHALSMLQV